MKKLFILFFFTLPTFALFESPFWNMEQAEKTFGPVTSPFTVERFKKASTSERAGLSLDLIHKGTLVNEKMRRIEVLLGKSDASFDGRKYPAYKITGADHESAMVVFMPDSSGQKVEEVRIAKLVSDAAATAATPASNDAHIESPLLPIVFEGDVAHAIYDHMTAIKENTSAIKSGLNATCARLPRYKCTIRLDDHGQAQ